MIKQEKFKVVNLIKDLIVYIDEKLINFPKKEIELKHKIKETAYELLLDMYKANNTKNLEHRIELQENCIAYIKFLDFMFNLCYEKQIINGKKYVKFGERLDMIVRYIVAWKNTTIEEKNREEKKRWLIIKRKANLYENIYKIENIMQVCDEVCRNTKNKNKVERFKEYKCANITKVYNLLKNREYTVGPYIHFIIYEPKKREIVSQGMIDKIVNHLVSRYILYPVILPCLIDKNVASRKYLGTNAGLEAAKNFHRICKIRYGKYYILKCDISKFFASINIDILKEKIKRKIKDKEALKIVFDIIDGDTETTGLGIGNMTSQILAIFYLNDMDHYIKEDLKIKYYVRYQDDFLLFHESKQYLKECLEKKKNF